MSLVSIVMPYYKKEMFVEESVKSLLNQSYQNFEIILINDDIENKNFIEKITSLDHRIKLIHNEKNLGAYILEEKISYKLLERNNKKPGPIIGFSKTLWVEEANNIKDLGVNGIDESFWRAKIEPTQFDKNLIGTEQEKLLKKAIYQLESFRKKELTTSEVFDTKQLAKVMAIRAIMGSSQFDWKDIKFYFDKLMF